MNNTIEIYRSQDGSVQLNVKLENETVWLTQSQMAELFGRDRTVITRHINNCYKEGELEIEVQVNPEQDTVWLNQSQMANLFDVSSDNIGLHIKNIINEGELDSSTTEEFSVVRQEGNRKVRRKVKFYNLDMIISVGYRVKSIRGIRFRKWANSILKDYMLKGYAVNEKRLESLNKTIEIQSKMLATALDINNEEVYEVVSEYTRALGLLDDYDHQCLDKPKGSDTLYHLSYDECRKLIDSMKFNSEVFI